MNSTKLIKIYPGDSQPNAFIKNTIKILSRIKGYKIEGIPLNHKLLIRQLPHNIRYKSDVTIINWIENNLRNSNCRFSVFGGFKLLLLLLLFNLTSKNLIYIRHNLYPHGMSRHNGKVSKVIADIAEKLCSLSVVMSGHLTGADRHYIPHPLYEIENEPLISNSEGFPGNESYYVVFGSITRYKKIHQLIEKWDFGDKLLVLGSPNDSMYVNELASISSDKNVNIRAEVVSNAVAQEILLRSSGMLIPHSGPDMIVSGSFFYAATLGVPVYAIDSPFFDWLKAIYGFRGIKTFKCMDGMISFLRSGNRVLMSPCELRKEANLLFGDCVVKKAWENLLENIT